MTRSLKTGIFWVKVFVQLKSALIISLVTPHDRIIMFQFIYEVVRTLRKKSFCNLTDSIVTTPARMLPGSLGLKRIV